MNEIQIPFSQEFSNQATQFNKTVLNIATYYKAQLANQYASILLLRLQTTKLCGPKVERHQQAALPLLLQVEFP